MSPGGGQGEFHEGSWDQSAKQMQASLLSWCPWGLPWSQRRNGCVVCLRQREPGQPPECSPGSASSSVKGEGWPDEGSWVALRYHRVLAPQSDSRLREAQEFCTFSRSSDITRSIPGSDVEWGLNVATTHVDQWPRSRVDFGDFSKYKCG